MSGGYRGKQAKAGVSDKPPAHRQCHCPPGVVRCNTPVHVVFDLSGHTVRLCTGEPFLHHFNQWPDTAWENELWGLPGELSVWNRLLRSPWTIPCPNATISP